MQKNDFYKPDNLRSEDDVEQLVNAKERIGEDNTKLARDLTKSLRKQGFTIDDKFLKFNSTSKRRIRKLHSVAVNHLLEKNFEFIKKYDKEFTNSFVADGSDVVPQRIEPRLITVDNLRKSTIFKWIKLHWSIPISSGYGRRLRYLVEDNYTGKIVGIIGLGDPVYALRDRDKFIGWSYEMKSRKLKHVMDAFVLGAIPPYSKILGGKLVASLVFSKEVYRDFKKKYSGKKSLIKGDVFDGKLAGITTSSALGRSSLYDRIRFPEGPQFYHVGWTSGSGDFQFLNGNYGNLINLVRTQKYTGKHIRWGLGIRSRRVVVKRSLALLGLSQKFLYHGIKRELFFVPMGKNWKRFLCGETSQLKPYSLPVSEISEYTKSRWMIPRSMRDKSYLDFKSKDYSLLQTGKTRINHG